MVPFLPGRLLLTHLQDERLGEPVHLVDEPAVRLLHTHTPPVHIITFSKVTRAQVNSSTPSHDRQSRLNRVMRPSVLS
jgi:hypothetical protein